MSSIGTNITKAFAGLFVFSTCMLLAIPMLALTFCLCCLLYGMIFG
jgi:hypothetical protein